MNRSVCGSFVVVLSLASSLFADLPGAQKYLEQAKQQVAGKEQSDRIETSLKLAEAELDGVGAVFGPQGGTDSDFYFCALHR